MTNPTTVTKWAIINNNLHGSYEFLKGRSSYQTNNCFLWVYKYESSNGKEVSSSSLQTYSKSLDLLILREKHWLHHWRVCDWPTPVSFDFPIFFYRIHRQPLDQQHPRFSAHWFLKNYQLAPSVGKEFLESWVLQFLSPIKGWNGSDKIKGYESKPSRK